LDGRETDTPYFEPSAAPFMINYRVDDLDGPLAALRLEGCEVDPRTEESEFFRRVMMRGADDAA
jgi:hypothetical protein